MTFNSNKDTRLSILDGKTIKEFKTFEGDDLMIITTDDETFLINQTLDYDRAVEFNVYCKDNFKNYEYMYDVSDKLEFGWITQEEYDAIVREDKERSKNSELRNLKYIADRIGVDVMIEELNRIKESEKKQ